MVFLGFGKFARADKIYALEPLTGDERGGGRRTRVWIEGVAEPIVAGRTERSPWLSGSWRTPTRAASTSATSAAALAVCSSAPRARRIRTSFFSARR